MEVGVVPGELLSPPRQLVGVMGLERSGETGRAVAEALTAKRGPDRLPIQFKELGAEAEFPRPKSPRRENYEGYEASGLLKRGWMRRQLEEVPALLVLFVELEWAEAEWAAKRAAVAGQVASLRDALGGRETELAVVVLQRSAGLPAGDDPVGAERARDLCAAAHLSPKALFVLPCVGGSNHLFGYVIRLEQAFYELAQNYYATQLKRVKAKKDSLSKAGAHPLLLRCHFKLGFLSELRQDSHTALRHYKLSYQHLSEARLPPAHWLEWKTVAGFLSQKIAALSFTHNTPLEAISHFRRHAELFRDKVGEPQEVSAALHALWMARQMLGFAQLFQAAVTNGLAALQTQHPGFYFHNAANQAIRHRSLVQRLRASTPDLTVPSPDPLAGAQSTKYYGQMPWRVGLGPGFGEAEAGAEEAGERALRASLCQTDPGPWILELLSAAVSQFAKYRSPRMRRQILLQVAEEYVGTGDAANGWKILGQAVWEGRREFWPLLHRRSLRLALRSLLSVASLKDFVAVSLQLLAPEITLPVEERLAAERNLRKVLAAQVPEGGKEEAWRAGLAGGAFFALELSGVRTCLSVRSWAVGQGEDTSVEAGGRLRIRVALLLSGFSEPLQCSAIQVSLSSSNAASGEQVLSGDGMVLESGKMKVADFAAAPRASDVGWVLSVKSVRLSLGQRGGESVFGTLEWSGEQSGPVPKAFAQVAPGLSLFASSHAPTSVAVCPRKGKVSLSTSPPAVLLLAHPFTLPVVLRSSETQDISGLTLVVRTAEDSEGEVNFEERSLACLRPGEEETVQVQGKATRAGQVKASVELRYKQAEPDTESRVVEELGWRAVEPLSLRAELRGRRTEVCEQAFTGASYLLAVELTTESEAGLRVRSLEAELSPQWRAEGRVPLDECGLAKGEAVSWAVPLKAVTPSQAEGESAGRVRVRWSVGLEGEEVESWLSLPPLRVVAAELVGEGWLGGSGLGSVRSPLTLHYRLRNQSSGVVSLRLGLEASESFMFAGHKEQGMRLLAGEERRGEVVLFPLVAGWLALPSLSVRPSAPADLVSHVALPSHAFVYPHPVSPPQPGA